MKAAVQAVEDECTRKKCRCNGSIPCDQCMRRNTLCVFTTKRKSGPKKAGHTGVVHVSGADAQGSVVVVGTTQGSVAIADSRWALPAELVREADSCSGSALTDREHALVQTFLKDMNAFLPLVELSVLKDAVTPLPPAFLRCASPIDLARHHARTAVLWGAVAMGAIMEYDGVALQYMQR
eukprot:5471-Heterococcus_DN1.PRE.4